jgi:cyanophycin synthetase
LEGSACVVKPASGTDRGTGVTGGIRRRDDLVRACVRAARWDERVLIERQVPGRVYRLLFLDGELLDAVARSRPSVVGDGRSTVADLIAAENRRRLATGGRDGLSLVTIDLDCVLALRAAGLGIRSVLAEGVSAEVKSATSQNRAGDNETTRDLAPQLVEEASKAAGVVGARLAGVDVITPDPTQSLTAAGGAILEVNTTPGFNPHYLVADQAATSQVAVPILRALLGAS